MQIHSMFFLCILSNWDISKLIVNHISDINITLITCQLYYPYWMSYILIFNFNKIILLRIFGKGNKCTFAIHGNF